MTIQSQRLALWIASLLVAAVAVPDAAVAGPGAITGAVDNADQVKAIIAFDRKAEKKYPGKIDVLTGKFIVEGLPLGATYDCLIDFAGARLEGVNLKVPRSDYEEEQPLSKEDVDIIKETCRRLNKFEDKIEVMTVSGNIQHAAVILNKLRTQPFFDSKPGEVVWRLELWRFERPEETWVKIQDELFTVIYRERLQRSVFDKKALTLDPALGGLQLTDKQPALDLGQIKLPKEEPGIRLRPEKASGGR